MGIDANYSLKDPNELSPDVVEAMKAELLGLEALGKSKVADGLLEFWTAVYGRQFCESQFSRSSEAGGGDNLTLEEPPMATMSLMSLESQLSDLLRNGQATPEEIGEQKDALEAGDDVRIFVESRAAIPVGTFTDGVTEDQAADAADWALTGEDAAMPLDDDDYEEDEESDVQLSCVQPIRNSLDSPMLDSEAAKVASWARGGRVQRQPV
jgi:hypothetical protein